MQEIKHLHLIGIGGSGLSAIALILIERGYTISGSDRVLSQAAQQVQSAGGVVYTGHSEANIRGADLVVRSSAIPDDNVEVIAAQQAGIPVIKRNQLFEELLTGYQTIAVAGTHGKTTTTAMLAWVLEQLGQQPSYIIGSLSLDLGRSAHAGSGSLFVLEADEYDRTFLGIHPYIGIITNIEYDHPDCYPSPVDYHNAFVAFAHQIPPAGTLVLCGDNPGAMQLSAEMSQADLQLLHYGVHNPSLDYYAREVSPYPTGGTTFQVICNPAFSQKPQRSLWAKLILPGTHNVRNALAVFAVSDWLNLRLTDVAEALADFRGTSRRFEIYVQVDGIILIDDYAHHPSEIRATLEAASTQYPEEPIWVVWQPHTYSRTRALFDDYIGAFELAEHLIITEIYAARESKPDNGFSAHNLVQAIKHPDVRFIPSMELVVEYLAQNLSPGDILLVLSAGDADKINKELAITLEKGDLRSINQDQHQSNMPQEDIHGD